MTPKEIREKNDNDLVQVLSEKRRAVWNFRFGATGSKVKNVKEGKAIRRDIARIVTIMNENRTKKSKQNNE